MEDEKLKEPDHIKRGRERLEEIERRIGRYLPNVTVRDGVKRGEWRSDYPRITSDIPRKGREKKIRA